MLEELFEEKSKQESIDIDNSKEASVDGKWENPGASLYDRLMNSDNAESLLKEAYLIAPNKKEVTSYSRSGCKYPHHVIRDGKLVVHLSGLKAAYSRAKQMGVFSGSLKKHIERHYKELGLYEGSTMEVDESIDQNFSFIEDYIEEETGIDLHSPTTLDDEYVTEKSQGRLKFSFRYGIDVTNGHKIKIVLTLRPEAVDAIYTPRTSFDSENNEYNTSVERDDDTKRIKNIRKTGNNNFVSKEIVKAIVDDDTKKQLKSVKVYGIMGNYARRLNDSFSKQLIDKAFDIDEKVFVAFAHNSLKVREFFAKSKEWNPPKEIITEYIVGKEEPYKSFKSTRAESNFRKFGANMNAEEYHKNWNARGIRKDDPKKLEKTLDRLFNEFRKLVNAFYRRPISTNGKKRIAEEEKDFMKILEIAHKCIRSNDIDHYHKAVKILKSSNEWLQRNLNNVNSELKRKSINIKEDQDIINQINESFEWMDRFFEAEEIPPPVPEETKSESNDEPSEKENKEESQPKKIDKQESNKNGVRRKNLYIAFIEWAKDYNPKNTFGSVFDKDIFQTLYPFVPNEMRYFYRLANPILCVLAGNLTSFAVSELKKLNAKNSKLSEFMIFAATDDDMRVFNNKDKKIYRATDENGMIKLDNILGETFDLYIQNMINQGDILNAPQEDE